MKFALVFLYKMSVMSAICIGFPIENEPSDQNLYWFSYIKWPQINQICIGNPMQISRSRGGFFFVGGGFSSRGGLFFANTPPPLLIDPHFFQRRLRRRQIPLPSGFLIDSQFLLALRPSGGRPRFVWLPCFRSVLRFIFPFLTSGMFSGFAALKHENLLSDSCAWSFRVAITF